MAECALIAGKKWGISSQKLTFSFPQSLLTCARSLEGASSPGKLPVLTHGFALWAFLQITPKSCAPGPNLVPGSSHDSKQEHPLRCFPPRLVSLLGLQKYTTSPSRPPTSKCYLLVFSAQFAIAPPLNEARRSSIDVCILHAASFHTY